MVSLLEEQVSLNLYTLWPSQNRHLHKKDITSQMHLNGELKKLLEEAAAIKPTATETKAA